MSGFLHVDDVGAAPTERRYRLSEEHAQVLLDRDAMTYLTPYTRLFAAAAQQLPAIMHAYRTGGGVNWRDCGPDVSGGQAWGNRPTHINALADWLASVDDLHERLSSGARVADVGCGGAGKDGTVLVMDENVQAEFVAPGYEVERTASASNGNQVNELARP